VTMLGRLKAAISLSPGAFAADVPSRKGVLDSSLDQRVFIGRR
jgi:hypothetical protein